MAALHCTALHCKPVIPLQKHVSANTLHCITNLLSFELTIETLRDIRVQLVLCFWPKCAFKREQS